MNGQGVLNTISTNMAACVCSQFFRFVKRFNELLYIQVTYRVACGEESERELSYRESTMEHCGLPAGQAITCSVKVCVDGECSEPTTSTAVPNCEGNRKHLEYSVYL